VTRRGELLSRGEGDGLKRVLNLDGKTLRGSGGKNNEALHVVSACSKDGGVCFGQRSADGKGHEIRLIKELLDAISVKNQIVTIDAIGAQTEIAEKIVKNKGDYVLAVKENQKSLHDEIRQFFADPRLLGSCARHRTVEKARGSIETRDCWQSADIGWLKADGKWAGLRSIGMTRNTILHADGRESSEERYFISSLPSAAAAAITSVAI
jgi:Transposase